MENQILIFSVLISSFFLPSFSFAQEEDLMKILEENQPKKKEFTSAAFKTTRLVNFQTLETVGKRSLDFRIAHRFGDINSGAYNAWGIDGPANIKLSLEYSYDGRLMFGLGRSSYEKMVDVFAKFRLVRQTIDNKVPLSITLFSGMYENRLRSNSANPADNKYANEVNRLSYVHQVIIGRKFSPDFSFQLAPTFVHFNLVDKITDQNDIFAVSCAARIKYTKRQAVTFEYCYRINKYSNTKYYDSMGIGWEVETGGHVFQVHVTNSFGISESQFIPATQTSWSSAGIRIGFNISRVFTI